MAFPPDSPPDSLREYLAWHDEEFVRVAHLGLLRRMPNPAALESYLGRLRGGAVDKAGILIELAFSAEARGKGVAIPRGLKRARALRRLFRVPVLGYILEAANALIRLPIALRNMEGYEAYMSGRLAGSGRPAQDEGLVELQRQFVRLTSTKADRAAVELIGRRVEALEAILQRLYALEAGQKALLAEIERLAPHGAQTGESQR